MKTLGYFVFALFFNICRIFPIHKKKVVLFNGHNRGLNGNLLSIREEIKKRNPETKFIFRAKQEMFAVGGLFGKLKGIVNFFVILPYHMATARQIYLNDNFLPLGYCKPSKHSQIIQLWHGAGAFKKFGLSVEADESVRKQVKNANKRVTHLFVTSKKVAAFYQEAFAIAPERIFATGIAITDIYNREDCKKEARERFYERYPQLKGKKILLYTPTFRQSDEENVELLKRFPVEQMHEVLGKDWIIMIKLHPKYPVENVIENEYCYNATMYPQISDLFFVADVLITDYSSTIVEYVLLDKPIVMYAYDLPEYDRGFYRDYKTTVPGIIAYNEQDLLGAIIEKQEDNCKRKNFLELQYDYCDGNSSTRILDILDSTKVE